MNIKGEIGMISKNVLAIIGGVLIIVILLGMTIFLLSFPYINERVYEVKEVTVIQDNANTLYSCEIGNGETLIFSNDDLLFIGKFNSSDFAVKLKEAEKNHTKLRLTVRGIRIKFLSKYPNITKIEEKE